MVARVSVSSSRRGLTPVVADATLVGHDLVEVVGLFDEDVAERFGLAEQNGLQTDELQHGEEGADEGALGAGVLEELAQADRAVLHGEAALDEVDHLADGDGVLVDGVDGAVAETLENFLEDADEVDGVGGDFALFVGGLQALIFEEVLHAGLGPGGFLDLLLLVEHLGGGFEALVLEEALDEFAARVFGVTEVELGGVAWEKHAGLDVDEQRGGVDELAGGVDVGLLQVARVLEELGGDARHRDVVDVDVLLADEVEQEVEGAVVDQADGDGEGG